MSRQVLAGVILALGLVGAMAAAAAEKPKEKEKPIPITDPAIVECKVPFKPATNIDGATATEGQIENFYNAVRRYQDQLAEYRGCIDKKRQVAQTAGDQVQMDALNKAYDQSVDDETEVVTAFQRDPQGLPRAQAPVTGLAIDRSVAQSHRHAECNLLARRPSRARGGACRRHGRRRAI